MVCDVFLLSPVFESVLLKLKSLIKGRYITKICVLCLHTSFLSRIILGGNKGHLADGGRHCFLPDLDLDGRSILSERRIHVTHGDVHF